MHIHISYVYGVKLTLGEDYYFSISISLLSFNILFYIL